MKKVFLISLLLLFAFSNVFCQKEYKILEGSFFDLYSEISELVSEGYEIDNYTVVKYGQVSYKEFILLCKDNNTQAKSYIRIKDETHYNFQLLGDIPSGFSSSYNDNMLIDVLKSLSQIGYKLEYFICPSEKYKYFLLSKNKSEDTNAIFNTRNDIENSVIEKARYNLDGIPVNENEKGVQIIVYSDYTTKIINVK